MTAVAYPTSDVDLFTPESLADPTPVYRELRRQGPLVWLRAHRLWAATTHEQVRAVLVGHERYTSRQGVGLTDGMHERMGPGSIILHEDPPEHDVLRDLLMNHLGPAGISRQRAAVEARVADLLRGLHPGGEIEVVHELAAPLAAATAAEVAGLPEDIRGDLPRFANAAFDAFGPPNDRQAAGIATLGEMVGALASCVRAERIRPASAGEDVVTAAARATISDQTALQMLAVFATAGVATTMHAIGNMLSLLAEHPDQWQAAVGSSDRGVAGAIDESLRLAPPVRSLTRTATRDATALDGTPVRTGQRVLLLYGSANRDEAVWPDPDRFDITRPDARKHLSFGRGLHACTGRLLAQLELEAVLRELGRRAFRALEIVDRQPLMSNTASGFARLRLKAVA